ncbi:MAG: hypothetical protein M3N26_04395 [Pseudomonadota bacterium]|nr:hypothetical protein [Pseudomonadota bacterium]
MTYISLLSLLGSLHSRPDGALALPDTPGLGFEPDPARLEPWIVERWCEELA